jgi:tetratricopeptide (TPR) repeat protein
MTGRWTRRRRTRGHAHEDPFDRRLTAERAAAVGIVRTIRELLEAGKAISPPAPEWVTVGVAEELAEAFGEVSDSSRRQARAIAECELAIATQLDDSYPPEARSAALAVAWTNLGTADLLDGAPRAALKCLDEADRALGHNPETASLHGSVDLSRASVLHAVGRNGEARKLVERAQAAFEEAGHRSGVAQCRELLAMIEGRDRPRR